jgi:N-hydroxyarylamine O-acetyltransferase
MDIQKYLQRIQYSDLLKPNLQELKNLQKSHLLHVPFENLDIHYGKTIELDIEKIYNKIVLNNRGGFCYELNGLFFELLKTIGFEVKMVSARVYDKEKDFGPEFDHMVIITRIENSDYLTDVGFGEFAFEPLRIELSTIQKDERGEFKFEEYDFNYLKVSKREDEKWIPQYIFSLQVRELNEYEKMCTYHQTSPDSHFTQKRVCSLPTDNGRITITGNKLKFTSLEDQTEKHIEDEVEFHKMLKDYFNTTLK